MKIKAEITIAIGAYENIKPTIEIDTENIEEAKQVVKALHKHFHGLVDPSTDHEKKGY